MVNIYYQIYILLLSFLTGIHSAKPPSILLIIADDLGIGDLGCYGNDTIKTPYIDNLSENGVQLEHHLVAATYCTPSRAALLTARYPARYGMTGSQGTAPVIIHVASHVGLPLTEITMAEAFKANNYTTHIVGKWHLGSGCELFGRNCRGPLNHGFDSFYGMLQTLTSAMGGDHSFWEFRLDSQLGKSLVVLLTAAFVTSAFLVRNKNITVALGFLITALVSLFIFWFFGTHYALHTQFWYRSSPWITKYMDGIIMRNETPVRHMGSTLKGLSQELVGESLQIIRMYANASQPFFLMHSFLHTHAPMFVHERNQGKSLHGSYGDNIEEMDEGVGRLMAELQKQQIENDTIVAFISDHGGALEAVDGAGHRIGGYNKQFKGGKGQGGSEGGIRVPGIILWHNNLQPGSKITLPTSLLDMLPTLLDLADLPPLQQTFKIHSNTKFSYIDGISFASCLKSQNNCAFDKNRMFLHHCFNKVHAIRLVKGSLVYKLHLFTYKWHQNSTQCGWGGDSVFCHCIRDSTNITQAPQLYELTTDPYEDTPLDTNNELYKPIVEEMMSYLNEWQQQVPYPPSLFASKYNNVWLPWLQPIAWNS